MQFCDVKDASQQGKHKGNTYTWNVYQNISTQGGTLTETTTVPESQFTIVQGTLTIEEQGNSVPYSGALDDLSEHPVREIVDKVLKHDAGKAFDISAHIEFQRCLLRVVSTATDVIALTTNGTATATNTIGLKKRSVGRIIDEMKERNIPAFTGDDYYCLTHPTTLTPLKTSLETVYQYTTAGFQRIMNGEIGRYENCRYVEQTFIPKGGATDATLFNTTTRTAEAWDSALSSWAFFIGEDTVAEAICVPEEVRGKIPTDFGRSKGVAWYYLGGFGLVHADTGTAEEGRIVKWDSAS